MTNLERDALGVVPLEKKVVDRMYRCTALPGMLILIRSHERLRMEVDGAMALVEQDRAIIEELHLEVKALEQKQMAHEKTAEEVRRNEWDRFTTPSPENAGRSTDMAFTLPELEFIHSEIRHAFEAGFAAGRRGERIEVAARLMTVFLGQ